MALPNVGAFCGVAKRSFGAPPVALPDLAAYRKNQRGQGARFRKECSWLARSANDVLSRDHVFTSGSNAARAILEPLSIIIGRRDRDAAGGTCRSAQFSDIGRGSQPEVIGRPAVRTYLAIWTA